MTPEEQEAHLFCALKRCRLQDLAGVDQEEISVQIEIHTRPELRYLITGILPPGEEKSDV